MAETRVIRGRWWLADKSSAQGVPGTLSDDEFRLELEDTLLIDKALRPTFWTMKRYWTNRATAICATGMRRETSRVSFLMCPSVSAVSC